MSQQIPYGNAVIVATPEINQARNQIYQQQQQRRMFQQQEMLKLDPVMDREFSRIRSVDVPAFTDAYNQYKNVKKQMLFSPQAQRDPQLYNQLNQQANEALSNTFSIADRSAQVNQMGKDLMTTRRTHPDVYDDQFGDKFKTLISTPYDQLENTKYGDLSNPDNFRYQHTIDFNQLHTKAMGSPKDTYSETIPTSDGLSNTTNTYQYGSNPKQYRDNMVMELAKLPTGEREAASAMQHYPPEMIDQVNQAYYANTPENQQKWLRTTGQPNPMPVEPVNPNSQAENYASLMSKLTWLNSNTPSPTKVQTTPNRAAIIGTRSAEQEKMQQNRFQQQKIMAGIQNSNATGRIGYTKKLNQMYEQQDAAGQNALVDAHFDDQYQDAKKQPLVSIPTSSGTPLTGYPVNPLNVVSKEFNAKDDKGHSVTPDAHLLSQDGKTMTGVYYKRDPKTGQNTGVLDESRTQQKDVNNDLKPVFRNFVAPKQKVTPTAAAPKVPVTVHKGLFDDIK